MATHVFGRSIFCDASNLSESRTYINNTLITKGILHDPDNPLKFNSADAPTVINLIYDFLKKSEKEDSARESLSERARRLASANDRLEEEQKKKDFKIIALQREIGLMKNQITQNKNDAVQTNIEVKQLRDELTKTTTTLNHTRSMVATELRKRDARIVRLNELLIDGGSSRRGKAVSTMTVSTEGLDKGTVHTASYAIYNPELMTSLKQESEENMLRMAQEVMEENEQLAELIQATLASLDKLVQIEEEEHPLFESRAQSIIMLEAQLKVRLTAVKNILDIPNYVPIEEVEERDTRIKALQARLAQVEVEWSAAQSVLKGLTASVLDKKELPEEEATAILTERKPAFENIVLPSSDHLRDLAKTPMTISKENGFSFSTVKLDSRLLALPEPHDSSIPDSTPVRAKREKVQRRTRRETMGLMATQDEIEADEESIISEKWDI